QQLRANLIIEEFKVDCFVGCAGARETGKPALKLLQLINPPAERCGGVILNFAVDLMKADGGRGRRVPFEVSVEVVIDELTHGIASRLIGVSTGTAKQQ